MQIYLQNLPQGEIEKVKLSKDFNILVWFYGLSTIVGYLMSNLIYTYILDIYDLYS